MFQGKGLDVQEVTAHGVPKDRTSEIRVQDWIGPMRAVGPLQLTAPVAEAETIAGLDTITPSSCATRLLPHPNTGVTRHSACRGSEPGHIDDGGTFISC